jgi:hypothetical protein
VLPRIQELELVEIICQAHPLLVGRNVDKELKGRDSQVWGVFFSFLVSFSFLQPFKLFVVHQSPQLQLQVEKAVKKTLSGS